MNQRIELHTEKPDYYEDNDDYDDDDDDDDDCMKGGV